jgi:hypothetical protein
MIKYILHTYTYTYTYIHTHRKNVEATAEYLGYDSRQAFLWDDNIRLKGTPHVVPVDPYNSMLPHHREELLGFRENMHICACVYEYACKCMHAYIHIRSQLCPDIPRSYIYD